MWNNIINLSQEIYLMEKMKREIEFGRITLHIHLRRFTCTFFFQKKVRSFEFYICLIGTNFGKFTNVSLSILLFQLYRHTYLAHYRIVNLETR